MSEAKHTPGPWHVSDKNASGNVSEDYLFIEPGIAVIERKVAGQDANDMPDARLIAAAPELLAALERMTSVARSANEIGSTHFSAFQEAIRKCSAVIAKATAAP